MCFPVSVGTNIGDIAIWEVGGGEKLVLKNFKVWDLGSCSVNLQVWEFCLGKMFPWDVYS